MTAIPETKHAPGWSWRKRDSHDPNLPLREERPYGWVRGDDAFVDEPFPNAGQYCGWVPAFINGLCESGWHGDCPQAPLDQPATSCQCACPCHQPQGVLL